MMEPLLAIGILFLLLAFAAAGFRLGNPYLPDDYEAIPLADRIDALLPQTQCGKCGYNGCRPYAEAIAGGHADINQCPPGGEATVRQLAILLGRESKPLNPVHGEEQPPRVAVIDEELCIGCVKCIRACPVDAILGAAKMMHTVIPDQCTGCELCIEPCPVDCISMDTIFAGPRERAWQKPDLQPAHS